MKLAPDPEDVQEFQFKQANVCQIFDGLASVPYACSLLAADKKRGLLYIGHRNRITVFKPGDDVNTEWQIHLDLPVEISKISLSCDCSYLAVTPMKPSILIYNAQSLARNSLELLHEIRVSSSNGEVLVSDIRWNPTVPGMLFTVANDYTIGSFQIREEKEKTIGLKALEKLNGVMCAAWSPKGKQIVVGCKNGCIVQLKPELKIVRTIPGPNPYIGEVISILWISNYQFGAAFLSSEQHINVLIIDAPKGETTASFTCYEDITYGMLETEGEGNNPRYYFDHVPEWGLIIAASSGSSEIAVLGTKDNGATWNQWQLVDSGRAQLPLIRTAESYPIGLVIDRTPTQKIPWGADSSLPHPIPILYILGTSGQLCSFHMVNLTPNCPAINSPPTETVTMPPLSCSGTTPAEISFSLTTAATSTPRIKQVSTIEQSKAAPVSNIFGDSLKAAGFFHQSETEQQTPVAPMTISALSTVPAISTSAVLTMSSAPTIRALTSMGTVSTAPAMPVIPAVRTAVTTPAIPIVPAMSIMPTQATEMNQQEYITIETKPIPANDIKQELSPEQKAPIDESIYVRAYLEEQTLFEKELRNKLEPQSWECGTEEERKRLGEKAAEIDQFLRDLRETTNSLSSDIAYLKALLLQSFAWVEETKSKTTINTDINTRNCGDNSKINELQRFYSYTQSQLVQATKVLDLEWSDHKSQNSSKMKLPSLEIIYQNLLLHNKIIMKQKSKIEQLIKHHKLISRSYDIPGLNRSMSNLNMTSKSTATFRGNTGVIQARCKIIASKTLSFTQNKQTQLKKLLCENPPRIIKPVNPSPVQDRLEATLSSLASLSTVTAETKSKAQEFTTKQSIVKQTNQEKSKLQSPLASLNSIVARIGSGEVNNITTQNKTQNKPIPSNTIFPAVIGNKISDKKQQALRSVSTISQSKQNHDVIPTFNQVNTSNHTGSALTKSFPKVESINFGMTTQKNQESLHQKTPPKESIVKNDKDLLSNNNTLSTVSTLFSNDSLKEALPFKFSLSKGLDVTSTSPSVPAISKVSNTDSLSTFSFANANLTSPVMKTSSPSVILPPSTQTQQTFSFASKPVTTFSFAAKQTSGIQSSTQESLDLTGLSLGISPTGSFNNNSVTDNKDNFRTMSVSEAPVGTSVLDFSALGSTSQVFNTISTSQNVPSTSTISSGPTISPTLSKTVPSPAIVDKVNSSDSGISTFGGNTAQPLPVTGNTASSVGQTSALNTLVLGGFSTVIPATDAFVSSTTSSPLSIFKMQTTTPSVSIFNGFSSTSSTTSTFATLSTTPTSSPFYDTLSKPAFSKPVTKLTASNLKKVTRSPSTTLNFGNATTVTSITPAFVSTSQFPGTSTTTSSSTANIFVKPIISPASSTFGSSSNSSIFNKAPATSPGTSIFGGNSSTNAIFGGNASSSSAPSIFKENAFSANPTGSIFENNTSKTTGLMFGNSTMGTTSLFGNSGGGSSPAAVGGSPAGSAPVFSGSTGNSSPMAAGAATPVLGSESPYRQAPSFGAGAELRSSLPMFGMPKSGFGTGFGTAAFGETPSATGGFGASPTIGGNPPPIENTMSKVFGSTPGNNTFESLASQAGGLTFGSLAQSSPEQEKPSFIAGSSFSKWR